MDIKHTAERALLLNQSIDKDVYSQLSPNLQQDFDSILQGQYVAVLERSPLFTQSSSPYSIKENKLDQWTKDTALSLLKNNNQDMIHTLYLTGVACLNLFVQLNWTGPLVDKTVLSLLGLDDANKTDFHSHCSALLSTDGEQVYHLSAQLGYLVIARSLFLTLHEIAAEKKDLLTVSFWARRSIFIQQQLLDECTGTLQELLLNQLTPASAQQMNIQQDAALKVRHELETALIYSYFHQDKEAFDQLKEAQSTSGFEWSITGALGKRTKFQQYDVSQLVVLAESKEKDGQQQQVEKEKDDIKQQPETIDLNDDTLLEKISFSETKENELNAPKRHGNLQVIDQCLLLGFCLNVKNTNPEHGMTNEQMVPFVTRVLENPNNWMVHTMGLLLRSRLEAHKSRTMERAALQLQALVDQIKLDHDDDENEDVADAKERMGYIYDLLLPSKWSMERELGHRFMGLGVIKSALDIFERLEMWEDVVACYQMLDQKSKARAIVERLLKEQPESPKLWCILGDIDEDPQYWEKAWEISHHRFARAMRSLGAHWFRKEKYDLAIDYYKQALAINPLFESSWFVLGCAAMMIDDWETGARAFQRVVGLDQDNAEGWNNLSSIYMKMDKKVDAFLALKQACKLKYDSWKMWQNLLYVSIDIGQFADSIWAMQRVVDLTWDKLRDQAVDLQCLQLLVESVIQNWKDLHDQEARRLSGHIQRLLENVILSRITNNPDIWRICGKFYLWQERYKDALDASLKSYRAVMHDPHLETDELVFKNVAKWALEAVDMYETLGEKTDIDGELVCSDWKYQSKSLLKSLMGKVRDTFDDTPTYESLKERLDDLKQQ
ncbi:hypothetical protein BJ944DRAFT_269499 [Cunninghamella echinulata]|nr:hypothetical protein BJ944DRAFT_269499 [Cunninghamella echinulata]